MLDGTGSSPQSEDSHCVQALGLPDPQRCPAAITCIDFPVAKLPDLVMFTGEGSKRRAPRVVRPMKEPTVSGTLRPARVTDEEDRAVEAILESTAGDVIAELIRVENALASTDGSIS